MFRATLNALARQVLARGRLAPQHGAPALSPLLQARSYHYPALSDEELSNQVANANLLRLVNAYRTCGHAKANLDPLGLMPRPESLPELEPGRYGLSEQQYPLAGIVTIPDGSGGQLSHAPLSAIVSHLEASYCSSIGAEFHLPADAERRWFAEQLETIGGGSTAALSPEAARRYHSLVVQSEAWDLFLQKRFSSVKRYGLEGAESMMVAADTVFSTAAAAGAKDVVLALPHRGRLNLLTGLLGMPASVVFGKLKGKSEIPDDVIGSADVLSHLAISTDLQYAGAASPLHVSMLHNPSHLEHIDPVALGKTRSRQRSFADPKASMCFTLHGDAAVAGQGVVQESLAMSQLPAYTTHGTVHLIVNNQLGFTATSADYRSSRYSSDVGRIVYAPVLHVNGDDLAAVHHACRLAVEFRFRFGRDIFVDLIGYRRRGHNELDEPAFTQPLMYKAVRARPTLPALSAEALVAAGVLPADATANLRAEAEAALDRELAYAAGEYRAKANHLEGKWAGLTQAADSTVRVETGVALERLVDVGVRSVAVPAGFKLHPRIENLYCQARVRKMQARESVDWATAEALAWGALLLEGYSVRISGQDVARGTFSQRHCFLTDQETNAKHAPLNALAAGGAQGRLEVATSLLSEMAVVGFEYGFSMDDPRTLTMWEAQFGDFANGAQPIFDQFVASAEQKWLRQSGLVTMLPHGYDGAGPEHSSARIERYLQLCDGDISCRNKNANMHVINPSTPANYFHALRRQMLRSFRKPLIVIGPKTLLRHAEAVSPLDAMGPGTAFEPVLDDPAAAPAAVTRVILCSGKIYYDLAKERAALGPEAAAQTAIVRLEELHPFPADALRAVVGKYAGAKKVVWAQEEPANGGAWRYVDPRLQNIVSARHPVRYAGRPAIAAVAVASGAKHAKEHADVMRAAFE